MFCDQVAEYRADEIRSKAALQKKLTAVADRARSIANELLAAPRVIAAKVERADLPLERGIYLWVKIKGQVEYVGVALGRSGLRQRIGSQHLRASYTQSVFRVKVAEEFDLDLRQESVDHIRSNYRLGYLVCDDADGSMVKLAESLLVTSLRPKYNALW